MSKTKKEKLSSLKPTDKQKVLDLMNNQGMKLTEALKVVLADK